MCCTIFTVVSKLFYALGNEYNEVVEPFAGPGKCQTLFNQKLLVIFILQTSQGQFRFYVTFYMIIVTTMLNYAFLILKTVIHYFVIPYSIKLQF